MEVPSLPFSQWPNDGSLAEYVTPRQRGRHIEVVRGLGTLPQDRLPCYGGSLATGAKGRVMAYHGNHDTRLVPNAAEDIETNQSRILDQLDELRHEAHLQMVSDHLLHGGVLCDLQAVIGEKTHKETSLCIMLLAASKEMRSSGKCRSLLQKRADPHYQDKAGNVALHHARTHCNVRVLLEAAPSTVSTLNWALQTPLETAIAHFSPGHSERLSVLQCFRLNCGVAPFFVLSRSTGATPYTSLSATERSVLNLGISWDEVAGALSSNGVNLIHSVRNIRFQTLPHPPAAADGAIHHFLFEEPVNSPSLQHQRLRYIWRALWQLLWAGCGQSSENLTSNLESDCLDLARWLLDVSKGADIAVDGVDSREPYRAELALCLAELDSRIGTSLEGFFESARHQGSDDCQWLGTVPPQNEMVPGVMAIPGGCGRPRLRNQLSTAESTAWSSSKFQPVGTRREKLAKVLGVKVDGSLHESWSLSMLHKSLNGSEDPDPSSRWRWEPDPVFLSPVLPKIRLSQETTQDDVTIDPRPGFFEPPVLPTWVNSKDLHDALEDLRAIGIAIPMASIMEVVATTTCYGTSDAGRVDTVFAYLHAARTRRMHELAQNKLRQVLEPVLSDPEAVRTELPENARHLSDIWKDAQVYAEKWEIVERTPAEFVCDVSSASVVYGTVAALRRVYGRCTNLTWDDNGVVLVRVANGFNFQNADHASSYRSLVLWLVVDTLSGPLVVQAELHLEAFYTKHLASRLLADCCAGIFEPTFLRNAWSQLLRSLSELFTALSARRSQRVEVAIEAVRNVLRVPELTSLARDDTIRHTLAAIEDELPTLLSEERALRDGHDRFETRAKAIDGVCGVRAEECAAWRLQHGDKGGNRWCLRPPSGAESFAIGSMATERAAALKAWQQRRRSENAQ